MTLISAVFAFRGFFMCPQINSVNWGMPVLVGNRCFLWISTMSDSSSKIGHDFRKKMYFKNWNYQKIILTTNVLLNDFIFNRKQNLNVLVILHKENSLWHPDFDKLSFIVFTKYSGFLLLRWFLSKDLASYNPESLWYKK